MNNIYQQIGLRDLVNKICGSNSYEIHKRICANPKTKGEIVTSQQEFSDFLNDEHNYLSSISTSLLELKSFKATYEGMMVFHQRASAFILYCRHYCHTIDNIIKSFSNITISSGLLKTFSQELQQIQSSISFHQLKVSVDEAYQNLIKILVFDYDSKTNRINKELQEVDSYENELLHISNTLSMKISAPGYIPNYFSSFSNFSDLKHVFGDEIAIINSFFNKYRKYNFKDFSIILNNLEFYTQMKYFFITIKNKNIPFCQAVVNENQIINVKSIYDISLINKTDNIVPNDIILTKYDAKFAVIAGANSGGKTTFIRALTINLLLFNAVGYVFAHQADITIFNNLIAIFKSFQGSMAKPTINDYENILLKDQKSSIIILNEIFQEYSENLALTTFRKYFDKIYNTNNIIFMVTHNLEIINFLQNFNIALYSPIIDKTNNYNRTYQIKRNTENNHTFVETILEKYGLLKEQLLQKAVGEKDE